MMVNSGRPGLNRATSSVSRGTTHIMCSNSSSVPFPGIVSELVLCSSGPQKTTLCGLPALRDVSGVFSPNQATCRECKARYPQHLAAQRATEARQALQAHARAGAARERAARRAGRKNVKALRKAAKRDRRAARKDRQPVQPVVPDGPETPPAEVLAQFGLPVTASPDDLAAEVLRQAEAERNTPTKEEPIMNAHVNIGHCGCPACSRERLARKAEREQRGSDTYYDRAMTVNAGGHPVPQPNPPPPKIHPVVHTSSSGGPEQPPPTAAPAPSGHPVEKRTTRADRDTVAEVLAEHYAAGSLDDDEYATRLDAAMAAKWPSQLRGLTLDLPDLPVPEPAPAPARPDRGRAFREESTATYRAWTGGQWAAQNAGAVGLAIGATALAGATNGALAVLSVLICCAVNGLLGLRKNRALGVVGLLTGPFLFLGTALMILLTWRRWDARLWVTSSRPSSPSSSGPWRCSATPARQRRTPFLTT
jgi:hypothetical protein